MRFLRFGFTVFLLHNLNKKNKKIVISHMFSCGFAVFAVWFDNRLGFFAHLGVILLNLSNNPAVFKTAVFRKSKPQPNRKFAVCQFFKPNQTANFKKPNQTARFGRFFKIDAHP